MDRIVKRAVFAALGVVVTLAWWSFTGRGGASSEVRGIPSKVWEGDAGVLAVDVESTTPAKFRISFSDDKERRIEAWAPVKEGTHSWAISIPHGAGGYIEFEADNPKVGDKLSWKITLNGETVDEQSETLDRPLQSGYAFFLQSAYDDYSTMKPEKDF